MKNHVLYFALIIMLTSCVSRKNSQFLAVEEVTKSTLRVNPKDTSLFELIFVNNTDQDILMGIGYDGYDTKLLVYDDRGKLLTGLGSVGSSRKVYKPGEKAVISENISIIVQMALKDAKMEKLAFGKYTLVWRPVHLRLNPEFKDIELTLEVNYDQGDIDYIRDFKKRELEAATKRYEEKVNNKLKNN